ncbi:MAG: thioredoxin domain-containing protein [Acidobacteria bacterium]|nr:thioredoxin domain-containing protein [Acidobacteriota bacterium]
MSSRLRWLILAFAAVGFGMAASSTWVHYRLLTDPGYVSPCDVNTTFSCSQVYLSRFGSLFGVPVAIGGLIWFGLVALIAVFGDGRREDNPAVGYLQALAVVGLGVVLYLGYVSSLVIRTGCLLCIGTYVCVAAIFVLAWRAKGESLGNLPARLLGDLGTALRRPVVLAAVLLYLAGAASVVAFFPRESTVSEQAASAPAVTGDARTNFEAAWARQPRVDVGVPADGAKVVVVKFNDFECPSCAQAELFYKPVLKKFEASRPGAVKYVVKDWPWNSKCNFNTRSTIPGHEAACDAAAAARIAKDQSAAKYEEMTSWLYTHQGVPPAQVREAAGRILGVKDFDKEYALKLPAIRSDIADGGVLGIQGTPTYYLNGVKLPSGMLPAYFELAIEIELNRP